MSMFRPTELKLYYLEIHYDSVWQIMNEIGKLSLTHLIDLQVDQPVTSKEYFQKVKQCDEALFLIKNFEDQMKSFNFKIQKSNNTKESLNKLEAMLEQRKDQQHELSYVNQVESKLKESDSKMKSLLRAYNQSLEARNKLIYDRAIKKLSFAKQIERPQYENSDGGHLTFIAGIVDTVEESILYRTLFRASKGNAFMQFTQLQDIQEKKRYKLINVSEQKQREKSCFVLCFNSGSSGHVEKKLVNIISHFSKHYQQIQGENAEDRDRQINELQKEIQLANMIVQQAYRDIITFFEELTKIQKVGDGEWSKIEEDRIFLLQERYLYININKLRPRENFLDCLIWVQVEREKDFINKMEEHQYNHFSYSIVTDYTITPPTKIPTNKVTWIFQEIVNTYGIARYREINPGLFTVASFPFLFGMMFGDMGHGVLLLIFAIWLLFVSKTSVQELQIDIVHKCRYILLLMAIFSIYFGVIYNEFFAIPVPLAHSCYNSAGEIEEKGCVYPIGVDPIWGEASNKLSFFNSMKMKLAIIIGVSQMLMGVFLKGLNNYLSGNAVDFFCQFIPQLLFLCSTFVYLSLLIVLKWLTDYSADTSVAPSILTTLLNFFLKLGTVEGQPLYQGQQFIQGWLILIVIVTVPWMLFPKPYIVHAKEVKEHEKHKQAEERQDGGADGARHLAINEDDGAQENDSLTKQNQDSKFKKIQNFTHKQSHVEPFSELFVHQMIETIEFVLGSVSHTASYLRLWALSLAHGQLSEVFFDKTMKAGVQEGNVFYLIIGFYMFAAITVGVIMCMDVMECFLHTLRLHWVEFQSKFYKGDGYIFSPFCFVLAVNEFNEQQ